MYTLQNKTGKYGENHWIVAIALITGNAIGRTVQISVHEVSSVEIQQLKI